MVRGESRKVGDLCFSGNVRAAVLGPVAAKQPQKAAAIPKPAQAPKTSPGDRTSLSRWVTRQLEQNSDGETQGQPGRCQGVPPGRLLDKDLAVPAVSGRWVLPEFPSVWGIWGHY